MRGLLRSLVAAGLLCTQGAAGLAAQIRVVLGVGGGTISPMSKSDWIVGSGEAVKSIGYNAQLMFGFQPPKGIVGVRLDGQYASVNHETATGASVRAKDKLTGGNLDLVAHLGKAGNAVRPYVLAGPSVYHDSYRSDVTPQGDTSSTKFGFNGGAGLNLGKSDRVWFFVEARYVYTENHSFIPATAGVRINTHQPYTKR
jgi:opacity protein-like surface antigen